MLPDRPRPQDADDRAAPRRRSRTARARARSSSRAAARAARSAAARGSAPPIARRSRWAACRSPPPSTRDRAASAESSRGASTAPPSRIFPKFGSRPSAAAPIDEVERAAVERDDHDARGSGPAGDRRRRPRQRPRRPAARDARTRAPRAAATSDATSVEHRQHARHPACRAGRTSSATSATHEEQDRARGHRNAAPVVMRRAVSGCSIGPNAWRFSPHQGGRDRRPRRPSSQVSSRRLIQPGESHFGRRAAAAGRSARRSATARWTP